ncbi:putative GTPase-activating protein [Thozetella sp. PMI_491]|nr:putative GTPase-activating protein [Thozetella sp. PMI_491]
MSLGDTAVVEGAAGAPPNGSLGIASPVGVATSDEDRQVHEVLNSEIGVATLLNRLKQSIASEFALFLKKRSLLEDDHANGLKKLCRTSQDSIQRSDHRGGTFAKAYEDMMAIHERMADNGIQYAMSLHQMQEDLLELAAIAEKSRKGWKQNGLMAEQRYAELEAAMRKSKSKYDTLAEDYDRARTGDPSNQKRTFGFKGPRSGAQHEEDLHRKLQGADQDYQSKVQMVQQERNELLTRTRPETVKALQDIIRECDSGLALQMQKFASFNEKLLLSNGLSISPLKNGHGDARSLRECILAINNDRDLSDYVSAYYKQLPPRTGEPKYERNPVLDQSHRAPAQAPAPINTAQAQGGAVQPMFNPQVPQSSSSMAPRTSMGGYVESPITTSPPGPNPLGHSYSPSTGALPPIGPGSSQPQQRPSHQQQHERSFSQSSMGSQGNTGPPYGGHRGSTQAPLVPSSRFNNGPSNSGNLNLSPQGAPQLGALSFQSSQPQPQPLQNPSPSQGPAPLDPNPLQQHPPQGLPSGPAAARNQSPPRMAPTRPVFGQSLARLYERDGLAVPMVVYQCIQAVDLYGLGVEGIYRLSGSVPHVNKLKGLFDHDSSAVDFRNPESFFHDVNSVAGLLKHFFRDLPDPLLTKEHYSGFIEAAKIDDDTVRRDSLHAIINNLPDPNYATLRALTLHLHRVIENSGVNRMSSQNLAIVFGPTLMGTGVGNNIADAGWQVRVVDTILQNTYQIFDDD